MITRRHRSMALLVAACFFMENLDATIVTTGASQIGEALRVTPTAAGILVTAYLLTVALSMPLSGWITSRQGARPTFLAAIGIFTVASLACALTSGLGQLLAMRMAQGVGGAMMVPVGRIVVLSRIEK